jgi:hypothetical protein
VVVRRERRKKVCARVALDTLLGGRSSAALGVTIHSMRRWELFAFASAPLLSVCALGAYAARGHVSLVLVLFWLSVLAILTCSLFARRSWKLFAVSVMCAVVFLYFVAPAAVTWTLWSFRGFAP